MVVILVESIIEVRLHVDKTLTPNRGHAVYKSSLLGTCFLTHDLVLLFEAANVLTKEECTNKGHFSQIRFRKLSSGDLLVTFNQAVHGATT